MPDRFQVRPIPADQTHALRHTVLRQHQRLEEMVYDGDDLPQTLHLGAFKQGGQTGPAVGVVTLNDTPMPIEPAEGDIRLRGMAVDVSVQGQGVGRLLVERALAEAADRGAKRMWCNARVSAMGFYQKLGFETIGEQFEIAHIGPHYVMHVTIS